MAQSSRHSAENLAAATVAAFKAGLVSTDDVKAVMGNIPPTAPVRPASFPLMAEASGGYCLCPGCNGSGTQPDDYGAKMIDCRVCFGNRRIKVSTMASLSMQILDGVERKASLVQMIQTTGLTQQAIDAIIEANAPADENFVTTERRAFNDLRKYLATPEVVEHSSVQSPSNPDYRPEIESFSLHTLKGKSVLKLTILGEHHYSEGTNVSNKDFANDGISLTNPSKMPPGPHKFLGKISEARVDYSPAGVRQYLQIELREHALITSGHYKARTVLSSAGASMPEFSKAAPAAIVPSVAKPIRKFSVE